MSKPITNASLDTMIHALRGAAFKLDHDDDRDAAAREIATAVGAVGSPALLGLIADLLAAVRRAQP